ncbi:prepilin peptidase [Yoonia sp. BS5-3]|uniref:Prepilin peptidase n=1 Tax=Yoonia phaeophyticola TaxID=3137369 RepID=A0ABZ2UZH5_9RHOB
MIVVLVTYAMAAVLIAAMVIEMRTGRIPNLLTVAPLALFAVLFIVAGDKVAMLWQLAFAAAVFAGGIFLYATAGIGAGAVKMLASVALFVPISKAIVTFFVLVGAMIGCALVIKQLRKTYASEDSAWKIWGSPVLPMSLPIGIAGLVAMFVL